MGLYIGWDFSTEAHKTYKCLLKALLSTLRKTLVNCRFLSVTHKFDL